MYNTNQDMNNCFKPMWSEETKMEEEIIENILYLDDLSNYLETPIDEWREPSSYDKIRGE